MIQKSSRNATVALTGAQSDKISEMKVNAQRVAIIITNLNAAGGASVYISVDEEAAANKGIQLQAGQSITFSKDAGYMPSQGVFNAYTAAAGTSIAIYEEIELRY